MRVRASSALVLCVSASALALALACVCMMTIGGRGGVREEWVSPNGVEIVPAARSAGVTEDWLGTVLAQIEADEYKASVNERGLQAPNRAHNIRTYFEDGGIEVVQRTGEAESSWSFEWRTTRWGREGELVDVADGAGSVAADHSAAKPVANGCRVTYDWGEIEEWYENKKEGLEQGFVVRERPQSEGLLCIEGVIGGGVRVELSSDGGAIDLVDENGVRVLRYAELEVRDAGGREVSSYLRLDGDRVQLLMDDAGAEYPLVVDPLLTSPSWTAESDQTGAMLGRSVGTAGDVNGDGYSDVIVGAHAYDNGQTDEGRAYVYHGSASGLSVTAAWTAESNQASAYFGRSVGTAGDVNGDGYSDVIVGAYAYDNGQTDEGRAYVYHGSATGLSVTAAWTAESDQASAYFGRSVGTAGDVNGDGYSDVIVGAYTYNHADNGETDEGRAYVYHGSASGLSGTAAWTAEGDQTGAYFGVSVGTAGDVNGDGYSDVIVGAYGYDNGQADEGRAYVYEGSASGLSGTAAWTAESDQAWAYFAWSVGTAGDVNGDGYSDVIVGAYYYDNGQTDEGRAYVYHGSASGLSGTAAWTAESDQVDARFGISVGTAGDVNGDGYSDVIVGAYAYDNGQTDEGRAYVYHGSASGLSGTAAWTAESDQVGARFGWSVGTAGDVNGDGCNDVIVGADQYDNDQTDEGRAYVYHGSASGLSGTAACWPGSGQTGAYFGRSVGTAGDVNGDGYSDVIAGAHGYDSGQTDEGRAYVYHGSASGLLGMPPWIEESDQADALFGISVGTAGDVNGDGYSDVIVGACYYDNGQSGEGRVYVYHGSATGLSGTAAWTAESDQADALFGISVGTAGDVNGDGYSDVIVGADYYDDGQTDEGRAYVYHGSASGLEASAAWTAESDQEGALFGISVGTAGDVNGDGYSDVIVGANYYDNGQTNEGRAYVYHGSATGLSGTAAWTAESDQVTAQFGHSVGTAGDVNGDGYSDVIVGADYYSNGQWCEGRAYVYHGSASGLSGTAAWTAESDQEGALFGISVGTAGDVNGDGYSDVIVGAYAYDNGQTDEGRAYVYHGSASGLAVSAAWTAESDLAGAYFGCSVGTAGDVNGDGYSDVIVGADQWGEEGRAYVYHGNSGGGLDRIARQARADDSAPVALLGMSHGYDGFLLKALGRTPLGRGNVRLQYEVKPLGTPFDGSGLVTGSAYDTGVPGGSGSAVGLAEVVSGLTSDILYHWRLRILTDSPFFPRSPWFSMPYNAITEADVRTGVVVGVGAGEPIPGALMLGSGAPNPFGASMQIKYTLPERGHVRLAVYDVAGREVALLRDGMEDAGLHLVVWDGRGVRGAKVASGVYFARLSFGGVEESRKIVLTQ